MSGNSSRSTVISVRIDNRVLHVIERLSRKSDDSRNKLINEILAEKAGVLLEDQ